MLANLNGKHTRTFRKKAQNGMGLSKSKKPKLTICEKRQTIHELLAPKVGDSETQN